MGFGMCGMLHSEPESRGWYYRTEATHTVGDMAFEIAEETLRQNSDCCTVLYLSMYHYDYVQILVMFCAKPLYLLYTPAYGTTL